MRRIKVTIFADGIGQWRWHMASRNGKFLAASSEAYKQRRRALENFALVTGSRVPNYVRLAGRLPSKRISFPLERRP